MGTLVGRGPALAAARAVLDDVFAGAGQVLLVAGEPGIGKTALLAAIARDAADRGARVLRGVCWAGAAPPWWPWAQVLRAADLCPGELGASAALVTRESARSSVRVLDSEPGATAADARFRVYEDVVAVLDRLSARAPLVVVLDDLQWADEPSLTLLDFAAAHLGTRPVLLLGAYRDTETAGPPVARAQVISLAGLTAAEVAAVMATVAGPRPSDEVADRVWRRSGGNPLHVRELTRLLVAGDRAADAVPPTVRDALARRVARLSAPCAEALTVAALAGPRVWPALLARVLPAVDVAAALDEAVRARVLVAEPGRAQPAAGPLGGGGFAFAHDLFRETVAAVPAPQRPDLHARIARALEDLRDAGAPVTAAEIATHLVAAHASAPPTGTGPPSAAPSADVVAHAVTLCAEAAAEASAGLGHRDACRHLEAALDLLDRVAAPGETRRALLAELAAARERAGDGPGARAGYRQLAALARRAGDTAALARAAAGVHGLGARPDREYADSIALLSEAAKGLADHPALRARMLAGLARDLVHAGWHAGAATGRAERTAVDAVRLAREVGDPAVTAAALLAVHDARWWPGMADGRLTVLDDMARSAERSGDRDLLAQAHQLRAVALLERGEAAGVAELARYAALAAGLGHARGRHDALTRRATLALLAGHLTEAAELAERALDLGLAIGRNDALPCFLALHASLAMLGGPPPPADRAAAVPDDDPVAVLAPVWRAAGLVWSGDLEAAGTALAGFDIGRLPDFRDLEFLAITAIAVTAAGSAAQRERCLARLAPFAGTHVVVGGCVAYSGPVGLHLGRLTAALGRPRAAAAHLTAAAEQCDRLGAPAWVALARADLDRLRPDAAPDNTFRCDGPVWTVCFRGTCAHLPDAKGLHDLATLLANPGVEVHVCTLLGRDLPALGADPVLDDRARTAYRRRLADLDGQLDRADVTGDAAASARLREERDTLVAELTAAAGLRGVPRRLGDETERARKAVSARLRDAITRIARVHPDLGAHLSAAVSTGIRCRYAPSEPTRWELRPPAGAPPVHQR